MLVDHFRYWQARKSVVSYVKRKISRTLKIRAVEESSDRSSRTIIFKSKIEESIYISFKIRFSKEDPSVKDQVEKVIQIIRAMKNVS